MPLFYGPGNYFRRYGGADMFGADLPDYEELMAMRQGRLPQGGTKLTGDGGLPAVGDAPPIGVGAPPAPTGPPMPNLGSQTTKRQTLFGYAGSLPGPR